MVITYTCDNCGAGPLNQPVRVTDLHENPVGEPVIDDKGPVGYTMHLCDECAERAGVA